MRSSINFFFALSHIFFVYQENAIYKLQWEDNSLQIHWGGCRPKSWFVRKQTVSFIHKNKQIFIFPLFTGAYKYDIFDNATLNILDILFYFWSNKKKIFNNIYYPISMRWEFVEIWTITYFIWCILPYFFLKIRVGLPSSL